MERVTISVSDEFAAELAAFMDDNRYANRSEAIRDLARLGLERSRTEDRVAGASVATLTYVYSHHTRELAKRLTHAHHARHDLQVTTVHVHLDHDNCLEVSVLRGDVAEVRDFARTVIAERGVRHGQVTFIPVTVENASHAHGRGSHRHSHTHPVD